MNARSEGLKEGRERELLKGGKNETKEARKRCQERKGGRKKDGEHRGGGTTRQKKRKEEERSKDQRRDKEKDRKDKGQV